MSTGTLRAIETHYKGYRFRSRLEARWAVFFDHLKIPYEYESEGFDLEGTRYLPDFKLPLGEMSCPINESALAEEAGWNSQDHAKWIEIKPSRSATDDELKRAEALSTTSGQGVYVISGDPYEGAYTAQLWTSRGWWKDYQWSECPACHAVDLQLYAGVFGDSYESDGLVASMFQCMHCDIHDRSRIDDPEHGEYYWHKGFWTVLRRGWKPTQGRRLTPAFQAARGARFEFGESGSR